MINKYFNCNIFKPFYLVSAAGTPIHDIPNSASILSNPTTRHPNPQQYMPHQQQPQQPMFVSFTPNQPQYQQPVRFVFFGNSLIPKSDIH